MKTATYSYTYYLLESNQGNHSGHNRTWTILGGFHNSQSANEDLIMRAVDCDDSHSLSDNDEALDRHGEVLVGKNDESFDYDGRTFIIATTEEMINDYFNRSERVNANGYFQEESTTNEEVTS